MRDNIVDPFLHETNNQPVARQGGSLGKKQLILELRDKRGRLFLAE